MAFGTKHKRKRTIATLVGGAVAGMAGMGTALAGTYIVPTDIDQYKQKTDQTYYDLYKNPNSTHGKLKKKLSGNREVQKLQSIGTPNVISTNNPLVKKSADATAGGVTVADGTAVRVNIAGKRFTIKYTSDGIQIYGNSRYIKGKNIVIEGDDAIPQGGTRCVSGGKYGCELRERTVAEIYFNPVSGLVTQNIEKQRKSYKCGKYGCSPTSGWRDVALVKSSQYSIDLARVALKGQTQRVGLVSASPNTTDLNALQGKYGSIYYGDNGGGGKYGYGSNYRGSAGKYGA